MERSLGIWVRRWPWLLVVAGLGLTACAAQAAHRRRARESYHQELKARTTLSGISSRLYHDFRRFNELARAGRTAQAGALLWELRRRPTSDEVDLQAIDLLASRLRVQAGAASEEDLDPGVDVHYEVWNLALEQRLELRRIRGDLAGYVGLLEEVVDGGHRHPEFDRIPFPYPENWASELLAQHYLAAGDGRRAYAWALRHKHEFAVDFDAPCGNAYSGEFSAIEDLVCKAAALAGVAYVPETRDTGRYFRRKYGPSYLESLGGMSAGALLAFAGVCVLTRRANRWPGRVVTWRLIWARRGPAAQAWWAAAFLAGLALQAWLGIDAFRGGFPPDPEALFWMSVASPLFAAPLVALIGCVLAREPRPTPVRPRPGPRGRRVGVGNSSRLVRRPPWAHGPPQRTADWILPPPHRRPAADAGG